MDRLMEEASQAFFLKWNLDCGNRIAFKSNENLPNHRMTFNFYPGSLQKKHRSAVELRVRWRHLDFLCFWLLCCCTGPAVGSHLSVPLSLPIGCLLFGTVAGSSRGRVSKVPASIGVTAQYCGTNIPWERLHLSISPRWWQFCTCHFPILVCLLWKSKFSWET